MIRQWVQENVFNIMNDVEQMVYAKKYISDHPDENAAQLPQFQVHAPLASLLTNQGPFQHVQSQINSY